MVNNREQYIYRAYSYQYCSVNLIMFKDLAVARPDFYHHFVRDMDSLFSTMEWKFSIYYISKPRGVGKQIFLFYKNNH